MRSITFKIIITITALIIFLTSCSSTKAIAVKNTHIPMRTTCKYISSQVAKCTFEHGFLSIIGHDNDIDAISNKAIHDFLRQIHESVISVSLENLSSIETLGFLDALADTTSVESLEIKGCPLLSDINIIREMPNLSELMVFHCASLSDISCVSGLNLTLLNVSYCNIKEFSVTNMSELQTLVLIGNDINNIEDINGNNFPSLRGLLMNENNIKYLPSFDNMPDLELVTVEGNPIQCESLLNALHSNSCPEYIISSDAFSDSDLERIYAMCYENEDIFLVLA